MDESILILIFIFIVVLSAIPVARAWSRAGAAGDRAAAEAGQRRAAEGRQPGAHDAPAEYLYVPCARIRANGGSAETRRWVQEVPIVRKTVKRIYYTSDTWDRSEAVVPPGCIDRQEFETDTRCHVNWPRNVAAGLVCGRSGCGHRRCVHFLASCRHGYPAGVIPIPGDRSRPGPAGWLFFATREAARDDLRRGACERPEQARRQASPVRELRRAMAEAHPDRGGTAEQFITARSRYQTALRQARR